MFKIFFILPLLCISISIQAQSEDYKTQTLFIYNFIKYASWPDQQSEFIIQVYGDSPILSELKQLASLKKTPEGLAIKVVQTNELAAISTCNILYVANTKSKEMEAIAESTKGKPYLIISSRDGMTKKGAVVVFFLNEDERMGFTISRNKLTARKIKMSGELMRMAELVD